MKPTRTISAAAAALFVASAFVSFSLFSKDSKPGPSGKRTVYSFVYALKHNNYGRACSYLARPAGGGPQCAESFTANVGMAYALGVGDPFAGIRVAPGSEDCPTVDVCTYVIDDPTGVIGKVTVTVKKLDSGKWRITGFR